MKWPKDKPNLIAVAADCHFGAVHNELNNDPDILIEMHRKFKHAICCGDNVDMSNVKKKEVKHWLQVKSYLKDLYKSNYVIGNHSCEPIGSGFVIIEINNTRVLFFHGPGIYYHGKYFPVYYSEKQTRKWENKKHGRGKWSYFKYKLWRSFSKHKGGEKRPSDKIIKKINVIMNELNISIACWAHTHRSCDFMIGNRRYINIGKGISYIEV